MEATAAAFKQIGCIKVMLLRTGRVNGEADWLGTPDGEADWLVTPDAEKGTALDQPI